MLGQLITVGVVLEYNFQNLIVSFFLVNMYLYELFQDLEIHW